MFDILKPVLSHQNGGGGGGNANAAGGGMGGGNGGNGNGGNAGGGNGGNGGGGGNAGGGNGGNGGGGGNAGGGNAGNGNAGGNAGGGNAGNGNAGGNAGGGNGGNGGGGGNAGGGNAGNGGGGGNAGGGNAGNGGGGGNAGGGNAGNGGGGGNAGGGNGGNGGGGGNNNVTANNTANNNAAMGGGGMGGGMGNACYIYPGAPATDGLTTPDVVNNRGIYMNGSMTMDDGTNVTIWGFTDGGGGMGGGGMGGQFPSPPIRVTVGQIVHDILTVQGNMWRHTIHHHGIEPSTDNDGVGHYSFDVAGTYTYQWIASHAGTYFYHCHTNTVLHAEMGMYGALIIDPVEGPGTLFSGGPTYDVEAIWACDEIDSSWHNLNWAAGTCGGDVGLHSLNPDYFIISGVDGANSALTDPRVATSVSVGETLLVRYICAGYLPQRITFGGLTASVYMSDGRALPNPFQVTSLEATAAERYDFIFTPDTPGVYEVTVDTMDWVTGDVLGTSRTRITVT